MRTVFIVSDNLYTLEDDKIKRLNHEFRSQWTCIQTYPITEETLFKTEYGDLTAMPGQILLTYWKGKDSYCIKDKSATIEEIHEWTKAKDEEYEAEKAKESTNENPQLKD